MYQPSAAQRVRDRVEVLAPAGDPLALEAALAAGADAVYFGVSRFNARARARNFSPDELPDVIARIHQVGARGYVTLNTLVFDREKAAVCDVVRACDAAGVDAIIVQDLGVAAWVRDVAPDMPLHASTQMTCTDAMAMTLAATLGISRVILPRELSIADIERIRTETDLELEVFVHGALCMSFSGQCLASLVMGGRSSNRGTCAQPCRLPYTVMADGRPVRRGFVLSPADLDASAWIPRVLDAGARTLKIEGRLKDPAYVVATVRTVCEVARAWEQGLDAAVDPHVHEVALQMFSRGSGPGFLAGVDHRTLVDPRSSDHRGLLAGRVLGIRRIAGKSYVRLAAECPLACGDGLLIEATDDTPELGGRVWSLRLGDREVDMVQAGEEAAIWLGPERTPSGAAVGARVFRTSSPRLTSIAQRWIAEGRPREPIHVTLTGTIGQPARVQARTSGGLHAQVETSVPIVRAERRAMTREVVADKIGRLGDTPWVLDRLEMHVPQAAMLPLSSLNDVRRRMGEALNEERKRTWRRAKALAASRMAELPAPPPPQVTVLCRHEHQARAAVAAGAPAVLLDLPNAQVVRRLLRDLRPAGWAGVCSLHVRLPADAVVDQDLLDTAADGVLVRSLGALASCSKRPRSMLVVADASLNVTNSTSARLVLSRGADVFTPSWELGRDALPTSFDPDLWPYAEFVAFGYRPMFHTMHCLHAAHLGGARDCASCKRTCDRVSMALRDRTGQEHPVRVDRVGHNTVLEGKPVDRLDDCAAMHDLGVNRFRIELLDETEAQTMAAVGKVLGVVSRGRQRTVAPGVGAPDAATNLPSP